ncbi:MAG TPA: TetR/AcrR family transcriptional regulator [Sandaracinaceae bacterium LLY-WYZ-13_1]|nr:TetR/AcrR family transcriptional regulator [Sandaracinaceae bacterium LLY-WYZ-13_1]
MDVRAQILDAATRLFAAQGYGGTSLSAISAAVGVRKASLLYHFPSKDALHRAVLDNLLSHWNEVLPRLLEAAAGDDRFDALLHETVRFFLADPDRARLLLREALDRPEAMRARLRVAVKPWMEVIAEYVRKGQAQGELRADADPEGYLLSVVHLVIGGIATADTLGVVLDDEGRTERLVHEIERMAKTSLFTDEGLAASRARRAARDDDDEHRAAE